MGKKSPRFIKFIKCIREFKKHIRLALAAAFFLSTLALLFALETSLAEDIALIAAKVVASLALGMFLLECACFDALSAREGGVALRTGSSARAGEGEDEEDCEDEDAWMQNVEENKKEGEAAGQEKETTGHGQAKEGEDAIKENKDSGSEKSDGADEPDCGREAGTTKEVPRNLFGIEDESDLRRLAECLFDNWRTNPERKQRLNDLAWLGKTLVESAVHYLLHNSEKIHERHLESVLKLIGEEICELENGDNRAWTGFDRLIGGRPDSEIKERDKSKELYGTYISRTLPAGCESRYEVDRLDVLRFCQNRLSPLWYGFSFQKTWQGENSSSFGWRLVDGNFWQSAMCAAMERTISIERGLNDMAARLDELCGRMAAPAQEDDETGGLGDEAL